MIKDYVYLYLVCMCSICESEHLAARELNVTLLMIARAGESHMFGLA